MASPGSSNLMDADTFVAASEAAPGEPRYELLDGRRFAMATERASHARIKNSILRRFERQIAELGLGCEAFPDGMAVRADAMNVFEPDMSVRCGPRLPADAILIVDPLIVVEVASPSTQRVDVLVKFGRYFRNPSLMHYLIVVPAGRLLIHHRRVADHHIETSSHDDGIIALDPPGLTLDVLRAFDEAG